MLRILEAYLRTLIKTGRITLETPSRTMTFGYGQGPDLAIRFVDSGVVPALMRNPVLAFGELYTDGRIYVTRGSLFDVQALFARSMMRSGRMDWIRTLDHVRIAIGRIRLGNGIGRSRRNVERHYDLSEPFYRLLLDEDMQYSCAYFADERVTLDQAQLAKKRHIAAKLAILPGQRVLDIGCGWGGMGLYLAQFTGATVKGVTLSKEQLTVARARAAASGLGSQVGFALEDYRHTTGPFDRIVSVGMLEHVGRKHIPAFFQRVADLLAPDGVALIHTIGYSQGPAPPNEWLDKHIFPGGYIPALSEVLPAIEKAGLVVNDVEILRLHYAETLRHWRERFTANRERAKALYDERFCRMWECYLEASEGAFRWQDLMVFQIQLTKRNDTLEITRDYIHETETQLASRQEARKTRTPRWPRCAPRWR